LSVAVLVEVFIVASLGVGRPGSSSRPALRIQISPRAEGDELVAFGRKLQVLQATLHQHHRDPGTTGLITAHQGRSGAADLSSLSWALFWWLIRLALHGVPEGRMLHARAPGATTVVIAMPGLVDIYDCVFFPDAF